MRLPSLSPIAASLDDDVLQETEPIPRPPILAAVTSGDDTDGATLWDDGCISSARLAASPRPLTTRQHLPAVGESLNRIHYGAAQLLRLAEAFPPSRDRTGPAAVAGAGTIVGPLPVPGLATPRSTALVPMAVLSNDIARGVGEIASSLGMDARRDFSPHALPSRGPQHPRHRTGRHKLSHKGCRSCRRVRTPQWRRGPDGPATLCNVCGLLYARQERRRRVDILCSTWLWPP